MADQKSGSQKEEATMAQFRLSSPSFRNNEPIPTRHTGDGADTSPALDWEGAPAGTKSFALICDDPDAQSVAGKVWVHWLLYDIPGMTTALPENVAKTSVVKTLGGAKQGMTDFNRAGYGGPLPPRGHGVHHYHFKLYALDAELKLPTGIERNQLEKAIQGHVLAQTELVGTYERT
jgi:Raf kinase inhibitor-like YbhB/YbcL family protein